MTEWLIDIYIAGSPKAQGSMIPVGRTGKMRHKPEMLAWRELVEATLKQWTGTWFGGWEPLDVPVEVHAKFYLQRPAKPRLEHAATGLDLDKLQRCLGDALEKSGVLKNDARIVRWNNPEKDWTHDVEGADGHQPGVRIKLRRIE